LRAGRGRRSHRYGWIDCGVAEHIMVTPVFAAILLRSARVTLAQVSDVTTTVAGVMLLVVT